MRSDLYQSKPLRLLICAGLPLGVLFLIAFALWSGTTPPCLFYHLTGLHCIGCGAGRFAMALLQGRIYAAFRAQPLLFLASPFLAYAALKFYLSFLFGRDLLPLPKIRHRWVGIAIAGVLIAYWILRNVPIVPFTYLAPTAV